MPHLEYHFEVTPSLRTSVDLASELPALRAFIDEHVTAPKEFASSRS
jgi:hypothetical protein